jgi:uncharacterized membrane protein
MKMGLKRTFFTGVLVTFPTALTLFSFYWLGNKIDTLGRSALVAIHAENYIPNFIGVGLIGTLLIIFCMGLFASNYFGGKLYQVYISIFEKIPFINHVFNFIKKVFEMILSQDNHVFKQAVLFEFPRRGTWMIGFLSLEACEEIKSKTDIHNLIAVFVPTTPNPTSGVLIFVPKNDLLILDMSLEEASKLIISGGILTPEKLRDQIQEQPALP